LHVNNWAAASAAEPRRCVGADEDKAAEDGSEATGDEDAARLALVSKARKKEHEDDSPPGDGTGGEAGKKKEGAAAAAADAEDAEVL